MAIAGALYLTVTLIQWCHAEILNTVPESWYSANVIKDGSFSPKPISEIFSTEVDTFSTINPIVVLPTSRNPPSFPPSSIQTSLDPFTGSTLPSLLFSRDPTTLQTFPSTPLPPLTSSLSTFPPFPSTFAPTIQTSPSPPVQNFQTFQTFPPSPTNPPTLFQSNPTNSPTVFQPNPTNSPTVFQPNPTNPPIVIQQTPTSPPNPSIPPNIQYILCSTCQQPTPSPPSSTPSPLPVTTSQQLISSTQTNPRTNPTAAPCATNAPLRANSTINGYPFIRIRMYSSRGSAPIVRSTTARTTTTRRPRRNRKNNYDACVNACGGGRNPICAAPLATRPVDPNALRGFPSICHMACYNSFKRIQYEKLVDGRCGRLRTRIRPVDSQDRIRNDDLKKTQYQVISSNDPLTVIEVQSKK